MVTLANAFVERGFTVDLVLATVNGPYLSEVLSSVNVVELGQSRVLTSLPWLVRYLRRRKPTALLSAMEHANLISLLAKKISRVNTRVVVSERNNSSPMTDNNSRFRSFVIRLMNRYLYRTADAVHAVSHGVALASARRLGLPSELIQVVYNPVVSQWMQDMSQIDLNFPWLKNSHSSLILAAGRLTKQKDFKSLIRAFSLVRSCVNARLVIMGEGELRCDLESLIDEYGLRKSVLLPGFVDNPFAVMKKADLFVLSSAWEGLPNVLIQAMACGIPVVATDCPSGPAEILDNGKWGRLVPVGDEKALARAMLDTLSETTHPDVAARAAYFGVQQAVDGYLRLLLPGLK